MKGDGDGPKVKSSSLFGYKYSISSILPVWEIQVIQWTSEATRNLLK